MGIYIVHGNIMQLNGGYCTLHPLYIGYTWSKEVYFGSKTSDSMDRWSSRGGKSRRRARKKKEDQRRERVRRKKIKVLEKVEKSRNCVFPILCGSGGSKSRLAKAAGAEPSGQTRDPKLHGAVAGSRFGKNTSCSEHFWKLRCRKCTQCGAKHA